MEGPRAKGQSRARRGLNLLPTNNTLSFQPGGVVGGILTFASLTTPHSYLYRKPCRHKSLPIACRAPARSSQALYRDLDGVEGSLRESLRY